MGLRALAQVLLGMLGFVLIVELMTALGNGVVLVGGAIVGAPLLFLALIGDGVALVVVSMTGRGVNHAASLDGAMGSAIRCECLRCDWTTGALTTEQARYLGQQHVREAHGGLPPTP